MARTIESPGVEFRERDLTLRVEPLVGTNTWVLGFANEGPTEEPITISSISEFESVFGAPTNPAERYFYYTSREYLNSGGNLLATRIPYGDNAGTTYGENFGALVFPVIPASATYQGTTAQITALTTAASSATHSLTAAGTFVFGQPYHIELTEDQYLNVLNNNVSWVSALSTTDLSATLDYSSIGKAGLVILDSTRSTINNLQEGYYIGVVDNAYANPAQDYNDVINVKSLSSATAFTTINSARIPFALSASNTGTPGSVSELLESVPNFTFDSTSYNDSIALGLFKVRKSIYAGSTNNVLDKVLVETFVGSLDASRMVPDPLGGPQKSFFIENVVNQTSNNIKVLVNPWISKKSEWNSADGNPDKSVRFWKTTNVTTINTSAIALPSSNTKVVLTNNNVESRSLYAVGTFATKSDTNKNIGNIPGKLDRIFACVSNPDVVPIDITVDAGLSTIWATVKTVSATTGSTTFDDTVFMSAASLGSLSSYDGSVISSDPQDAHEVIYGRFNTFAESTRKDHIHISDPLRQLFINGSDYKVFTAKCNRVDNPFSKAVYWPLRNLYQTANSSYAASYANWVKVYDAGSDIYCWAPFSGWAARTYAETDRDRFPWIAPAGLTRGIVRNVVDLAINPNQKERDLLYRIGQNPVCFFPNDGFVIWGQKTLFRKPSAFDRVNVRRLFIALEKPTVRVMKYFVFEPNTVFTRTQVVNTLTPLFEQAKRNEGVYDYMIVCDERNNTPDIIDRNELVVDIYIKPVRAAEFILVNFIATRTSQDFAELL
jgi:hypothetical protein